MIPIDSKCYVKKNGVGLVEAVCNDKPMGGVSLSYCVRLSKAPDTLQWFPSDEVTAYDEPKKEKVKDKSSSEEKPKHTRKRTYSRGD